MEGNKKGQRKAAAETRGKDQELRKQAKAAEAEVEKLGQDLKAIDQAMFDPSSAKGALAKMTMTELMKRRAEVAIGIEAAELAWMEANEAIEAFTAA